MLHSYHTSYTINVVVLIQQCKYKYVSYMDSSADGEFCPCPLRQEMGVRGLLRILVLIEAYDAVSLMLQVQTRMI